MKSATALRLVGGVLMAIVVLAAAQPAQFESGVDDVAVDVAGPAPAFDSDPAAVADAIEDSLLAAAPEPDEQVRLVRQAVEDISVDIVNGEIRMEHQPRVSA